MTREQIEKAAINKLPYTDEECADSNYVLGKNVGFKRGFIAGVRWRINSLWHDVSEKPEQDKVFLYEDEFGKYDTDCIYKTESVDWNMYSRILNLVRWAYIDDLLPERKDEAE